MKKSQKCLFFSQSKIKISANILKFVYNKSFRKFALVNQKYLKFTDLQLKSNDEVKSNFKQWINMESMIFKVMRLN